MPKAIPINAFGVQFLYNKKLLVFKNFRILGMHCYEVKDENLLSNNFKQLLEEDLNNIILVFLLFFFLIFRIYF